MGGESGQGARLNQAFFPCTRGSVGSSLPRQAKHAKCGSLERYFVYVCVEHLCDNTLVEDIRLQEGKHKTL